MLTKFTARFRDKLNSDSHFSELIKGSSTAFVLRIIGILAGYIFTLIITRKYGAKAMGIFALSFTLLQISSVIGRLGMDTALLRFVAEYSSQNKWNVVKDIYKKALSLVVPFSILLAVMVYFLSEDIAKYCFRKPYLAPYFKVVSLGIVPFVLLFINTESLRGLKKIKEYMLLQQSGIFILGSILLGFLTLLLTNLSLTITNNKLTITNFIPISTYLLSVFIISVIAFITWKKYLTKNYKQSPPITTNYNELLQITTNNKMFASEPLYNSTTTPLFNSKSKIQNPK